MDIYPIYPKSYTRLWRSSMLPTSCPTMCGVLGGPRAGSVPSLKLTASLHLKMDGWKTIVSFWGPGLFSGANCYVSFRGLFPCICMVCMVCMVRNGRKATSLNGLGFVYGTSKWQRAFFTHKRQKKPVSFGKTQVFRNGGFFAAFQWISDYHSRCLELRLSCRYTEAKWFHGFHPWEVIPIWPPWWLNHQPNHPTRMPSLCWFFSVTQAK